MSVKCLHATVLASLSEYLLPLQVGVKVPNAAEKVAHEVKAWVDESVPGELILQVDMKNAFNTLDRIVPLEEVKARSPLLVATRSRQYSLGQVSRSSRSAAFNKATFVDRRLLHSPCSASSCSWRKWA